VKDKVVMSPMNGQLAIAVPLFRVFHEHELEKLNGYSLHLTNEKPAAYAIECFDQIQLMNADFVESNLEFLGDL
jgi:hypothetical protein